MLYWLSHHAVAKRETLKRYWVKFCGESNSEHAKKQFNSILYNLHYLGHIEFEFAGHEIIVAPPTLVQVSDNLFYWVGARTPDVFDIFGSYPEIRIEVFEQANAPSLWQIESPLDVLEKFVAECVSSIPQLAIIKNESLNLLKSFPSLQDFFRQVEHYDGEICPLSDGIQWEKLTVSNMPNRPIHVEWRRVDSVDSLGMYRYRANSFTYNEFLRTRQKRMIYIKDHNARKVLEWFIICSHPLYYSPVEYDLLNRTLERHVNLRFPFVLERGLHLHSGRVPEFLKKKWLYKGIDENHAREVFRILNHPFSTR